MKEISLNILDIAENSVKAGALLTSIEIEETEKTLCVTITDDGCGMSEETKKRVIDPFYTTRTTRSVGLGIPLFKMSAEQTGGEFSIESSTDEKTHGTKVCALFRKDHIDCTPLGDTVATMVTLIQGHPETDFLFIHKTEKGEARLDTRELRQVLGDDVPLSVYEVIKWIEEFLKEQYINL